MASLQERNQRIQQEGQGIRQVLEETERVIVGQSNLIDRLLIGLLCSGHVLVEGVPGLAKTLTVRTLADTLGADFQRIQFTPDLLPADLIGTQIYNPRTGEFTPHQGPIFSNIVLADEINRAPAKVQSALLEAMEERQVTLGDTTYTLESPFMVLATQNPIEQEGTYPLPEAQLDRFMLKAIVDYPARREERTIIDRMSGTPPDTVNQVLDNAAVFRAQQAVTSMIYVDEKIKDYVLDIIQATRNPDDAGINALKGMIAFGASPRGTLALIKTAKAHAFIRGRGYVTPEDVKRIAPDVLRHRIVMTFEAEAEDVTTDAIIQQVLQDVPIP